MQSCCEQLDIFTSSPSLDQTLPQLVEALRFGAFLSIRFVSWPCEVELYLTPAFASIEDKETA